ncbi:hypothetical protein [Leuconostoc lactis]|uniref:hypothetical protein n=1 Tax=Leuconostoc lactis TaxID=1246 RepID=UPI0024AE58CE|nr:hypothetical protein [Leuconostoc lactis]MDI6495464.1 hypothetical protein [Leuconostoc lactis]
MTYTFDDAIEELEKLQGSAGYATQGEPEALRFSGLDVNWFLNEATQVIEKLRDEYAPTVEMTSGNKATFIQDGDSLSKLLTGYFGFDTLYWGDVSERKVAQAWLHPETIKVVDE